MTGRSVLILLSFLLLGFLSFTVGKHVGNDTKNYRHMDIENLKISKHEWNHPEPGQEPGIEQGVSAAFVGRIGNRLIMAGGCNFPHHDPISPEATKRFYKGIYAADSTSMIWERIGSLPDEMAYGVTAAISDDELVLIGGTTAEKSLSSVFLLTLNDTGEPLLIELPSLPTAIDNASVAVIGRKVYVAGGNVDGKPSNRLFMLDMGLSKLRWESLKDMPGNNRVQPVMASGKNPGGETCLYLFGGFSPRFDGNKPTLNVDGLVYIPSADKWEAIKGPIDDNGEGVSLAGGCAATLTDGRIAFAGGVNRNIFLEALINQAPDYLQHPVEWYRFNPMIFVFDASSHEWQHSIPIPDVARAGAGMVAGNEDDIYIIGGELKPRVRSSETVHIQ